MENWCHLIAQHIYGEMYIITHQVVIKLIYPLLQFRDKVSLSTTIDIKPEIAD